MIRLRSHAAGFSFVELLVAVTIGSFVVVTVISLFLKQSMAIQMDTQRDMAAQEARMAYELLSRLLRHAQADSIRVSYTKPGDNPNRESGVLAVADDDLAIDFLIPAGHPVWPNDTAPYANHAVRLTWSATAGTGQYEIRYATATSLAGLASAPLATLAGAEEAALPKIINFDFWPMQNDGGTPTARLTDAATGGYWLSITTRTALPDPAFVNPEATGDQDPLRHFRTYVASGIVAPRN